MGYTKLFSEIIHSTIWAEPAHIKIVWVTLLAMADDRHEVRSSVPGLAKAAGVSLKECEEAIKCFMSPDKYSRSQEYEGRRIMEVDGGWRLLNGEKYRKLRSVEERREYQKQWMADKRKKEKSSTVKTKKAGIDVPPYISLELWSEWMDIRKKKKAVNSLTALKALLTQLENIEQNGKYTSNEAITKAIENSWKSVKLEWLENLENSNAANTGFNKKETSSDIFAADAESIRNGEGGIW